MIGRDIWILGKQYSVGSTGSGSLGHGQKCRLELKTYGAETMRETALGPTRQEAVGGTVTA